MLGGQTERSSYSAIKEFRIDGHVHVHACYDEEVFLTAAHRNLSADERGCAVIMLAEMAGANVFARWQAGAGRWTCTPTGEDYSIVLGDRLLVIAGRQIVTAERVEVLAQFTTRTFADGLPLETTIEEILQSAALPVLPWGVGKWWGGRGRRVREVVERYPVFLGDNAGRPTGWPTPRLFRGRLVLPGSDPLRLASQQQMAGSYGFMLPGPFVRERPGEQIRRALQAGRRILPVGRRTGVLVFLVQQIGLRARR